MSKYEGLGLVEAGLNKAAVKCIVHNIMYKRPVTPKNPSPLSQIPSKVAKFPLQTQQFPHYALKIPLKELKFLHLVPQRPQALKHSPRDAKVLPRA